MSSVRYGIIILGNSGVGKSFLGNILLGEEVFVHKYDAESVTHEAEFEDLVISDSTGVGVTYGVFNIPGLIESNQERIDLNKREIDKAFKQCPTSIIMYVFGQQNGRIRDEDVVAFNAINDAYRLNKESLILVVNGLNKSRPKDYEGRVMVLLKQLIKMDGFSTCFLEQIDPNNVEEKTSLKTKMLQLIVDKTAQYHVKQHDIRLQLEEVKSLKETIKNLTAGFEQQRQQLQQQIQQQQNQYEQLRIQHQNESQYFKQLLEKQQRDVAETQKQMIQQGIDHNKQISDMEKKQEKKMSEHRNAAAASSLEREKEIETLQAKVQAAAEAASRLAREKEIQAELQAAATVLPPNPARFRGGDGRFYIHFGTCPLCGNYH